MKDIILVLPWLIPIITLAVLLLPLLIPIGTIIYANSRSFRSPIQAKIGFETLHASVWAEKFFAYPSIAPNKNKSTWAAINTSETVPAALNSAQS